MMIFQAEGKEGFKRLAEGKMVHPGGLLADARPTSLCESNVILPGVRGKLNVLWNTTLC